MGLKYDLLDLFVLKRDQDRLLLDIRIITRVT